MSARNCATSRLPSLYCWGDHDCANAKIGHSGSSSELQAKSDRNDEDTATSHAARHWPIERVARITELILTCADVAATGATAAAVAVAVGAPGGGGMVAGGVDAASAPLWPLLPAAAVVRGVAGTPGTAGIGSRSRVLIGEKKPSETCAHVDPSALPPGDAKLNSHHRSERRCDRAAATQSLWLQCGLFRTSLPQTAHPRLVRSRNGRCPQRHPCINGDPQPQPNRRTSAAMGTVATAPRHRSTFTASAGRAGRSVGCGMHGNGTRRRWHGTHLLCDCQRDSRLCGVNQQALAVLVERYAAGEDAGGGQQRAEIGEARIERRDGHAHTEVVQQPGQPGEVCMHLGGSTVLLRSLQPLQLHPWCR